MTDVQKKKGKKNPSRTNKVLPKQNIKSPAQMAGYRSLFKNKLGSMACGNAK